MRKEDQSEKAESRAILLSYRCNLDSYFLVNIKITERSARTCNASYLLTNVVAKDEVIFIFLMCYTEAVLNHFALCTIVFHIIKISS